MDKPTIDSTLAFAAEAHKGATDKYGRPYILHVLRVMVETGEMGGDDDALMVALLHDVIEDTDTTLDDLRDRGYSDAVITAVDAISRRDGEDYQAFVRRAAADPIAWRVKKADLLDNMNIRRADVVRPEDAERLERYRAAWQTISDHQPPPQG